MYIFEVNHQLLFRKDAILTTSQTLLLKRGNRSCLGVHRKPVDDVLYCPEKCLVSMLVVSVLFF